jgi:hypothetical protein
VFGFLPVHSRGGMDDLLQDLENEKQGKRENGNTCQK